MGEIRTVTTLRHKREEIRRSIIRYEEMLSQAKADLAHVSAAITIFEGTSEGKLPRAYIDMDRLFAWGETMRLAKAALEAKGPMDTNQLSIAIIEAKGLDAGDRVLAKSITKRIIHPLTQQARRGTLVVVGKRNSRCVWALPSQGSVLL
jgi:hypothetical protein